MSRRINLQRRKWLAVSAAVTGLAATGTIPAVFAQGADPLRDTLQKLFSRLDSAVTVGRACASTGSEFCALAARELFAGDKTKAMLKADDVVGLKRYFAERRQQDFESGRTVNVDGWILSRTEAQLCALVAYLV